MNQLVFTPAVERPDLISPSVLAMLNSSQAASYEGANYVIIEATRGSISTIAACLAPLNYRIDLNGAVRKTLSVFSAS